MKPTKATAWACKCGKLYRYTDAGKALAKACCVCIECGKPSGYATTGGTCRLCTAEREVVRAKGDLVRAKDALTTARGRGVE